MSEWTPTCRASGFFVFRCRSSVVECLTVYEEVGSSILPGTASAERRGKTGVSIEEWLKATSRIPFVLLFCKSFDTVSKRPIRYCSKEVKAGLVTLKSSSPDSYREWEQWFETSWLLVRIQPLQQMCS